MLNIFSEELRSRREGAGISVQQVAAKTRIDKKYLELIEQGNFTFLPELYIRAFIKEYALVIGLDPSETLKKYQLAKEGKLSFHSEDKKQETEDKPQERNLTDEITSKSKSFVDDNIVNQTQNPVAKKNVKLIATIASIIGLLMIFVIYFFINSQKKIIVEETPFEKIVEQDRERFAESTDNLIDNTSVISDSLILEIFSKDTTWVYLILDNSVISEITLYPRRAITFKAKNSFEGTIGNSGSAVLKLNDKNLDFIGRKYLPRHFRIDRSAGLEYLNSRPTLNNQNVR